MAIYAITTHHTKKSEAADAWTNAGVCAVGFYRVNLADVKRNEKDLRKFLKGAGEKPDTGGINELLKFLAIKEGDIVMAYQAKNIIAAVGRVIGGYEYNDSNQVGNEHYFDYPHQKKVEWFDSPREFNRDVLPMVIANQLGKRGRTTIKIETNYSDEKFLELLDTLEIPSYEGKFREDIVKAGISKYVKSEIANLEKGLKIKREEKPIDEEHRPDFIAEDASGKTVLIECKGKRADIEDVDQAIGYRKSYGKDARCFLIAFSFTPRCIKLATQEKIEIFEAELNFIKRN